MNKPILLGEQQWDNKIYPVVCISCITYNQKNYIRDAINGFLSQKTTFPIDILIHDDASTDGTTEIIREYEAKYPNLINCFYEKDNTWNNPNRHQIWAPFFKARTRGKYIALCEGDDYWTDPYKLQKQVDFLEENPDFSMCSHAVDVVFEDDWKGSKDERIKEPIIIASFEDIINRHFIPTNSLMFRNSALPEYPKWAMKMISGDVTLEWILASHGKSYFINEIMGVKRINGGGITATPGRVSKIPKFYADLYYHINRYTKYKYHEMLYPKIFKSSRRMIKKGILSFNLFYAVKYFFRIISAKIKI